MFIDNFRGILQNWYAGCHYLVYESNIYKLLFKQIKMKGTLNCSKWTNTVYPHLSSLLTSPEASVSSQHMFVLYLNHDHRLISNFLSCSILKSRVAAGYCYIFFWFDCYLLCCRKQLYNLCLSFWLSRIDLSASWQNSYTYLTANKNLICVLSLETE